MQQYTIEFYSAVCHYVNISPRKTQWMSIRRNMKIDTSPSYTSECRCPGCQLLTVITLLANSPQNGDIFLIFSQKTGFDISCKLSPFETICMKCQILFCLEKEETYFTMSVCWKFYPECQTLMFRTWFHHALLTWSSKKTSCHLTDNLFKDVLLLWSQTL